MVASTVDSPVVRERAGARPYQRAMESWAAAESIGFLYHGDVEGIAYEDVTHRGHLLANLLAGGDGDQTRDVVAVYHLASGGITFYDKGDARLPAMRDRATGRLGGEARAAPAAPSGEFAAILGGIGPQASGPQDPFTAATRPTAALDVLTQLLTSGPNVAVVIDYADTLCPAPAQPGAGAMSDADRLILVTLLSWSKHPVIQQWGNPIFLLCRELADLHPALRLADAGWKAILLPLPDRAARLEWIEWYVEAGAMQAAAAAARGDEAPVALVLADGLTVGELATVTAGLSLRNLEDVVLIAKMAGGMTRALLKRQKDEIIASAYADLAEMIDPLPGGFAGLGGAEALKAWFRSRVIAPMREGRKSAVPKNIVLTGPPGTGKTYFARAMASECGLPAVALNMAKILGGVVGESERNLARTFGFIRALQPCLVFLDEVDQTEFAQRGDQSGNPVAMGMFNGMMQFMSDENIRGEVLMILATNRPDKLDTALIRDQRVDAIIPVLLPDAANRRAIAAVQAAGLGAAVTEGALDLIAADASTQGYSAAAIGSVVREAWLIAGAGAIDVAAMREALDDIRPSGLSEAKAYTDLALKYCNKRSLLPPEYRAAANDRTAIDRAAEDAGAAIERAAGDSRRARRAY